LVILNTAIRGPALVGAKIVFTWQLAPTERLLPQLFVSLKSFAFGPLIVKLEIVNGALPMLAKVKF